MHITLVISAIKFIICIKYFVGITNSYAEQFASTFFNIITVAHLHIDFSQLSIILTSLCSLLTPFEPTVWLYRWLERFAVDPRRFAVGKKTVAGERMRGWQRGLAGGKNNYRPGVSLLVKKPLSCTVICIKYVCLVEDYSTNNSKKVVSKYPQ